MANLWITGINFLLFLNNYHYITLITCVLFISVAQSVHSVRFLNIPCLPFLSVALAAPSTPVQTIAMVRLTSMHASLLLHKLDLKMEVLNLICLFVLYIAHESSI